MWFKTCIRLFVLVFALWLIGSAIWQFYDWPIVLQIVLVPIIVHGVLGRTMVYARLHGRRHWLFWICSIGISAWAVVTYAVLVGVYQQTDVEQTRLPYWMQAISPFVVAFAPFFFLAAVGYEPLWEK